MSSERRPKLPLWLSTPPPVAWPTLSLAIASLSWFACTHFLYYTNKISYWCALPQWVLASYVSFTPLHDAVHNAIASSQSGRLRVLNAVVGHLCAFTLCAPFVAFRYLHLQHHRHTNVPGKDPDLWAAIPRSVAGGARWSALRIAVVMPLRWATQLFAYLIHYSDVAHERPHAEALQTVHLALVTVGLPLVSLVCFGRESYAFWCYAFPGYATVAWLAFTFDFLPHRPHATTDVLRGTNVTTLSAEGNSGALTVPMLAQNYHVIHHLYPWIPFYRYREAWQLLETVLVQSGVSVLPILPLDPTA